MRTIRWVLSYFKEKEKFTTNLVFHASSAPFMLGYIVIDVFFMQTHEKETQLVGLSRYAISVSRYIAICGKHIAIISQYIVPKCQDAFLVKMKRILT